MPVVREAVGVKVAQRFIGGVSVGWDESVREADGWKQNLGRAKPSTSVVRFTDWFL